MFQGGKGNSWFIGSLGPGRDTRGGMQTDGRIHSNDIHKIYCIQSVAFPPHLTPRFTCLPTDRPRFIVWVGVMYALTSECVCVCMYVYVYMCISAGVGRKQRVGVFRGGKQVVSQLSMVAPYPQKTTELCHR